ncbi:MAG: outer membrane lipoprotein carrier protein LolA [Gimesia chilikensis]|uniref:outer membrane lipoprotein carrier protein LolA n=1 Tax=Gimesia chilikensis TaxID=2605989 RepID=UPI00379E630B
MLRNLTFMVGLLLLAGLYNFFPWEQLSQAAAANKDTATAPQASLALADPESSPAEVPEGDSSGEKNLKKNPGYAEALLKKSREKLLAYSSIQADITETVQIGPKPFHIKGKYLQGKDLKLRLEFEVQSRKEDGKPVGTLLEICDGQVLWTEHNIKGNSRVTRRDVQAILKQAQMNPNSQPNLLVAELGLGGLPGLLAAIQKNMQFESVAERTINGKTLTVLNGSWKEGFLAQFKGGDPNAPAQLPAYVPDGVRIYLDPDTLFPRRIVYLKKNQETMESMVTLNFSKVTLNAPIAATQFAYEPPDGVFPVDITHQYLKQLSQ